MGYNLLRISNTKRLISNKHASQYSLCLLLTALFLSINLTPVFAADTLASNDLLVSYDLSNSDSFGMLGAEPVIPNSENILEQGDQKVVLVKLPNSSFGALGLDPVKAAQQACIDLVKSTYKQQGILINCSPNYEIKVSAIPNDPSLGQLWGMNSNQGIDAPLAWDVHTGSSDAVVAIIDTGIDYNHPDLRDNLWNNPFVSGCQNGGTNCHGYNAINNSNNPLDGNGHGTHVAGTIAARGNNSQGVVGVNWRAKLIGIKFLGDNGSGSLASAIQGINWMVNMKNQGVNIRVSNNSWGGGGYSAPLRDAIMAAHNAGIIFVAAAGNSANDNDASPSYPASYDVPNIVSVAALDSNRNLAGFSNYGASTVHIGAPGVSILSTYPNANYASLSGTSMAAPHVAGLLTLLHAANPSFTNSQLIQRMYASGIPLATLTGLVSTGRMISAARALHNQTSPIQPPPGESVCEYSMQQIAYNPDTSADNAEIIQQSDEFGFKSVSLNNGFKFHDRSVGSAIISPNGVIYTKAAPTAMDYRNSTISPLNSIAGLHSDLKAVASPYGARFVGNSTKAVFSWLSKSYGQDNLGDARIRVVLHSNGVIDTFFEASTDQLFQYLKNNATIGITGPTQGSARVFSYNSLPQNNLAIRYTPQCGNEGGGDNFSIQNFKAIGVRNSSPSPRITPNGKVGFVAQGQGSKNLELAITLNGYLCSNKIKYEFINGIGYKLITVPRFVRAVSADLLNGNTKVASTKIGSTAARHALANKADKMTKVKSSSRNIKACNRIAAKFN